MGQPHLSRSFFWTMVRDRTSARATAGGEQPDGAPVLQREELS